MWAVFRYEDVKRVLSDYEVFSSAQGAVAEGDGGLLEDSLVATNPPRHRRLRSLAQPEGWVALPMMLGQLAKIRRDSSVPLEPLDSGIMYGVKNLLITFAAA